MSFDFQERARAVEVEADPGRRNAGEGAKRDLTPAADDAPTDPTAAEERNFAGADAPDDAADEASPGVDGAGQEARRRGPSLYAARRAPVVAAIGGCALAAAPAVSDHLALALALGAFGVGALAIVAMVLVFRLPWTVAEARLASRAEVRAFLALHREDPTPVLLTDEWGRLLALNAAARAARGAMGGGNVGGGIAAPPPDPAHAEALFDIAPGGLGESAAPQAEVYRLLRAVRRDGAAEARGLRFAGAARLAALRRIAPDRVLWRLEPPAAAGAAGLSAALDALGLPALMREAGGLRANASARRLAPAVDALDPDAAVPPPDLASAQGAPLRAMPLPTAVAAAMRGPDEAALDAIGWLLLPAEPRGRGGAGLDLLDRLPIAVARLDVDGLLVAANERARRLLGPSAVAGVRFELLAEGLGRSIEERVLEAARGRSTGRAEIARGRREDRETFLQLSFSRIEDEGRPSIIAVMSDATELKTLEAQFVQSQKMQAVGQLAGGVAHDFNNLLTAIAGHTDLLLMRHDATDADHSDLMQIRQNSNRAAALVRQMLAFSRKQTLQPTTTNLVETLTELSHLLNRLLGEKVRLKLEHAPGLGLVRVDERQFEQVVMNLVVNARDAMPGGGEVRVRTRNARFEQEFRRDRAVVPPGDYVAVEVSDTGHGIPPDRIGQIFEPFYTTKKPGEGTGLGLSTAYGIVKQTGGFIFADSPPGEGAVFTVYLPRLETDAGGLAPAPAPRPPGPADAVDDAAEGVVLLVEDEAPVRSFASRALGLRGYTVVEAENAEEALEILRDPGFRLDVIVSDVVMPGLDGPSWVKTARETRPEVAVVFVSGYAEGAFRRNLEGLSDFVFLPKPYSLADLSAAIQEARGGRCAA